MENGENKMNQLIQAAKETYKEQKNGSTSSFGFTIQ